MLTHLTSEIEEGEILHPVVVVYHLSGIGILRLEVEKLGYLFLDALLIVVECLGIEQVSLLTLTRGVANHTGGTTHKDDGFMATTLQVTQHHDATQVSDVEGVGCGVSSQIGCYHLLLEEFLGTRHHLCQHTAPFQFFNKILHIYL